MEDPADETPSSRNGIFKELLKYSGLVFHVCSGFSANVSDAEELYQEVYLKAWSEIASLRDPDAAKPWLLKIARNLSLNQLRQRTTRKHLLRGMEAALVERETPERQVLRIEQHRVLKQAVRGLPKKTRDVFVLREYGQLSYDAISETLGIKAGTVMSRLSRARRSVLAKLKENGYGTENERR